MVNGQCLRRGRCLHRPQQKMSASDYKGHRNSYTELNAVYFWTITIKDWVHLLKDDAYKHIIISSLQWLSDKK